jgi:hypothetical protein
VSFWVVNLLGVGGGGRTDGLGKRKEEEGCFKKNLFLEAVWVLARSSRLSRLFLVSGVNDLGNEIEKDVLVGRFIGVG